MQRLIKHSVIIAALALCAILYFYPKQPDPAPVTEHSTLPAAPTEQRANVFWEKFITMLAKKAYESLAEQPQKNIDSQDVIEQAKRGQINLIATLIEIRQQCPRQWQLHKCNEKTRQFITQRFQDKNQQDLLNLYDQYIQYENDLYSSEILQRLDLKSSYEAMQALREQYFDYETRSWLFGMQDARMAYEFAKRDFLEYQADRLDVEERLAGLEEIRKETLGSYLELFNEQGNQKDYYQTQLDLVRMTTTYSEKAEVLESAILQKMEQLENSEQAAQ